MDGEVFYAPCGAIGVAVILIPIIREGILLNDEQNEIQTPALKVNNGALPFTNRVNTISTDEPWQWLALGWMDLRRARWISIFYGSIFVAIGYAVTVGLYQLELFHLIWPFATGFVLVAPVFAVGVYELSHRMQQGESPTLKCALLAWRAYPSRIFGAGLAMTFFLIMWTRTAALIYVLNFPYEMLTIQALLNQTFFSGQGLVFLCVGTLIGAVFAITAFLLSAVSLPMMVGEHADFLPAVLTSVIAVTRNPKAMTLWAAIIVGITILGMATAMIGLAVTLPLIGHATWHAYQAIVRPPEQNT